MKTQFILYCFLQAAAIQINAQSPIYLNTKLPAEVRAKDLVSRLSLEEKVQQMTNAAPAIPRLNIPAYNWWNEALHGVGRSGPATVFPQAIGLAATFDNALAEKEASAISDEARALYNVYAAKGNHGQYSGLTFWTPNINIFRDPRWGRGQETYGEDPFLTAQMGVGFVKGLQGNDPRYLKTAACAKHYAVHSGPEKLRHEFNATVSKKDLWETYLPAFHALVNAGVNGVMCAYNATNNEPCCGNQYLLQDVLREQWKFKGYVTSDCGALADIYEGHKFVANKEEAAALAIKRGVNLDCGDVLPALVQAVKQGLMSEKTVDSALTTLMLTRFKLGLFDAVSSNPYNKLRYAVVNSNTNRNLARTVAQKSIVLLKNNGALPLKNDLKKYFVTGPNASNVDVLLGNYYGLNSKMVTILEGIVAQLSPSSQIEYRPGILLDQDNSNPINWAISEAKGSDATILVMGISGLLEGEEGESIASPSFGDRLDYNIPKNQIDYLKKLRQKNNKPIIAVVTGGSPMNLTEVHELADAVLMVWYPGEEGGNAVADVIFGKISPSGKLPITFPKSLNDLPAYENYSMQGRTYRYMQATPQYPFGFGLSYTHFTYNNIRLSKSTISKSETITAEVTITNTGKIPADEVVQLYVTHPQSNTQVPLYSLKGFKRITLAGGASQKVSFSLTPEKLQLINEQGQGFVPNGDVKIFIGGTLPSDRSLALGAARPAEIKLTIK